jgi:hypothetical protein
LQAAATVYRADVVDRDGARGVRIRIRTLSVPGDGELWWGPLALGCIAGDRNAGAGAGGRIGLSGKIADENGIP